MHFCFRHDIFFISGPVQLCFKSQALFPSLTDYLPRNKQYQSQKSSKIPYTLVTINVKTCLREPISRWTSGGGSGGEGAVAPPKF